MKRDIDTNSQGIRSTSWNTKHVNGNKVNEKKEKKISAALAKALGAVQL